jgi:hypothetical protein
MEAFTTLGPLVLGIRTKHARNPLLMALTVGSLACSGCYSTWDVGPNQISKLDSYRSPQKIELVSKEGDSFTFDRDTTIRVPEGRPDGYRFETIDEAVGTITGTTVDGLHVSLASDDVKAEKFSVSKTVAVSVGVPLGIAAVGGLVGGVLLASMSGGGGFGGGSFGGGCAKAIHSRREL